MNEKKKFIEILLNIFCILSIFSIFGFGHSKEFLTKYFKLNGLMDNRLFFLAFLWMIIPLISIFLGKKYEKKGFKSRKNINIGTIVCCILFLCGGMSFFVFLTEKHGYNEIDKYREIMNLDLPEYGMIASWEAYNDDRNKYGENSITINYKLEDTSLLEESVKKNENWKLDKDVDETLKIFYSENFKNCIDKYTTDNYYVLIYNKTTDEYNTVPIENGRYDIYIISYSIDDKIICIHNYRLIVKDNEDELVE